MHQEKLGTQMPCFVPKSSIYGSVVFIFPSAWNWTQVSHVPGSVLKLLDFFCKIVKWWLLSWLPFVEGVDSWKRLSRGSPRLRGEGMPVLGMLRELLDEVDLKQVSTARPQDSYAHTQP